MQGQRRVGPVGCQPRGTVLVGKQRARVTGRRRVTASLAYFLLAQTLIGDAHQVTFPISFKCETQQRRRELRSSQMRLWARLL
jgi:hypothetical protein